MSQVQSAIAASAPAAVMLPGQTVDEITIGAFDHFSMPTQIAIGSGVLLAGGAAGFAAHGLTSSMLGGSAIAVEGGTAAGFTGVVLAALPWVAGAVAAGAVSYGAYKAIEKLLGGPTTVSTKGGKPVVTETVDMATAAKQLANLDIDPKLLPVITAAIEKHNAEAAARRAEKKAEKAMRKAGSSSPVPA
jgi:hypothetical protein